MFGQSEGVVAEATMRAQELARAMKDAADAGKSQVDPGQIPFIDEQAAAYGRLTDTMAALQKQKAITEFVNDMDFETAIAGLSDLDRDIAKTLRDVGVTAESVDGQRVAGSIRVREQIERQNAALDQQRDILDNVASTFLDIFDTSSADSFFDRVMSGLSDIGRQFGEIGKQKLMENLFGSGANYTAGAPYPGQRSTAPAGFPAG